MVVGMDEVEDRLAGEAVRGSLGVCVLAVLAHESAHGYAVAVRLGELGLARVRSGAVYPVLTRLEEEGALEATWTQGAGGPGRKVYRITAAGRARMAAVAHGVAGRAEVLDRLVAAGQSEAEGEQVEVSDLPAAVRSGR